MTKSLEGGDELSSLFYPHLPRSLTVEPQGGSTGQETMDDRPQGGQTPKSSTEVRKNTSRHSATQTLLLELCALVELSFTDSNNTLQRDAVRRLAKQLAQSKRSVG